MRRIVAQELNRLAQPLIQIEQDGVDIFGILELLPGFYDRLALDLKR